MRRKPDDNERNRGESSGRPEDDLERDANLGGYYARDDHRGGYGDDYAREGRGPSGARPDSYGFRRSDSSFPFEMYPTGAVDRPSDLSPRNSYRGMGPKGYRRADARILEEVNERLTEHHEIDAREVEVEVTDGEVVLTGRVPNRRMKKLCEFVADAASGVRDVHNRLQVLDRDRQEDVHVGKVSG